MFTQEAAVTRTLAMFEELMEWPSRLQRTLGYATNRGSRYDWLSLMVGLHRMTALAIALTAIAEDLETRGVRFPPEMEERTKLWERELAELQPQIVYPPELRGWLRAQLPVNRAAIAKHYSLEEGDWPTA